MIGGSRSAGSSSGRDSSISHRRPWHRQWQQPAATVDGPTGSNKDVLTTPDSSCQQWLQPQRGQGDNTSGRHTQW